jgi:hypothetical protein
MGKKKKAVKLKVGSLREEGEVKPLARHQRGRKNEKSRTQWYTPTVPATRRLRQEDLKFQTTVGTI